MSSASANLSGQFSAAVAENGSGEVFLNLAAVSELKPPPPPPAMLEMSFGDWKRQKESPRTIVTSRYTKAPWFQGGFKTFAPPIQSHPPTAWAQPKHFMKTPLRLAQAPLNKPKPLPMLPAISAPMLTAAQVQESARLSLQKLEPQIYVPRPKTFKGGQKANWIPKPPVPPPLNATSPESREEKQRLWREYRQAMKPFKNREFANAKRTIQRLGKKSETELDEKERGRLERAQEVVATHKAVLSQKATLRMLKMQHHSFAKQVEYGVENTKSRLTVLGLSDETTL